MNRFALKLFLIACTWASVALGETPIERMSLEEVTKKITPMKGLKPAQWRLIWDGDASTEARISWSTAEAGSKHTLHYGKSNGELDPAKYALHQEAQRNGSYTLHQEDQKQKIAPAHYHHADIKGLEADTKYWFLLESDGQFTGPFYFRTAPKDGSNFSLLHGGDSRSGILNRCRMNLRMAHQLETIPAILGLIHGGDYVAQGNKWSQWRLWLSQNELTTAKDGRVLPMLTAKGNHDGGKIIFEAFGLEQTPTDLVNFTTNIGKDVAMVTLDTNRSGASQVEFLEAELKKLRPQCTWLLTQYHRPIYPAVKTPARHKEFFCPLFDKYQVDLACESDGHCVKRTPPILDDKLDPKGTVYIGEGGLGVGQRKPNPDHWYLQGGIVGSKQHVMRLDFTPEELTISTVVIDGSIFDKHTLKVRNK